MDETQIKQIIERQPLWNCASGPALQNSSS